MTFTEQGEANSHFKIQTAISTCYSAKHFTMFTRYKQYSDTKLDVTTHF